MTTATPDVDDFDLMAMVAELDEHTAQILAAETGAEPTPPSETVVVEDEIKDVDLDALTNEDIDLDAMANELAEQAINTVVEPVNLEPTTAQKIEAEQELDLDEVFSQDTPVEPTADTLPEDIGVEIQAEVTVETHAEVPIEPDVEIEIEPETEVEIENKTIPNFEPKPATTEPKSEKALMELTRLKYQPDMEAFNREIAFTDATLDTAMTSQASLVAYQTERAARSAAQASRLKLKFDSIEAMLYEAYRKAFVDAGEKVTEKAIENAVRKDSRWRSAKESVIEAEMYADIHKGFVFALKDRNDMLIQRGSYRRQEMQGQMRFIESTHAQATQHTSGAEIGTPSAHAAAMRAMQGAKKA